MNTELTKKFSTAAASFTMISAVLLLMVFSGAATGHPVAQLSITQSGDVYTLDASNSYDNDGMLQFYEYDFDDDGTVDQTSSSSTLSRAFSDVPDKARVTVVDGHGNRDSSIAQYPDRATSGYCDINAGFLRVYQKRITEGETTTVMIPIYNEGDDQDVRVTFYMNGDQVEQTLRTVDGNKEKISIDLSPEKTTKVTAVAETVGAPCGDFEITETEARIMVEEVVQRGTVEMTVENQDGQKLDDARVSIRNKYRITDTDGRAVFALDPGTYTYEVTRNGYSESEGRFRIKSGKRNSLNIQMVKENAEADLDVRALDPHGEGIDDVRIEVRNSNYDKVRTDNEGEASLSLEPGSYEVTAFKSGYGSYTRSLDLEPAEQRDITFNMERVERSEDEAILDVNVEDETGDDIEDARVRVENGDTETGFTDSFGNAQFELEADTYDVRVSKDDYGTEERTVTLDEGDFRTLELALERDEADEDARLEVDVEDEEGDELENARVRVENGDTETEFTDDDGEAVFHLEPDDYDVEVSKSGYRDQDRSITLYEGDDRNLRFELEDVRDEDDARLDVEVEDDNGDELEDARVEVENGDREVDFTDDDGEARFYLEPDDYEIEVSRNGYRTETADVELDEGERETERFTLDRSDGGTDLEIRDVRFSESTVCRGDTFYVNVDLRNNGEDDTFTVGARGAGSTVAKQVNIDEDEDRTVRLKVSDSRGSGAETLEVAVTNGDTQTFTRSVTVRDCGQTRPPGDTATSVSLNVHPDEISAGESVKVTGFVDGTRGSQEVELYIDDRKVADLSSARDGYFSTHVTPQRIGNVAVEARSGGETASKSVRVLPNVYVGSVSAPDRVFESSSFEVCADVQSQATPSVVLIRDGERIDSKREKGDVCFETEASEGERDYRVLASAWGVQDSKTRTVEVLPEGSEVENFPDKLAMVRSGDGIVRVSLYNTGEGKSAYDVSVEGIPEDWFATSEREVVLTKGERENVYFYVTPEAEGNFVADIEVEKDGDELYRTDIEISSGGTTTERKTWIERIASLFENY